MFKLTTDKKLSKEEEDYIKKVEDKIRPLLQEFLSYPPYVEFIQAKEQEYIITGRSEYYTSEIDDIYREFIGSNNV